MLPLLLILALGAADEVVARIDGTPITASDFAARLAAAPGAPPAAVLEDLLNDSALAAEALRLGYAKDPRVVQAVERERRRVTGDRFLAKALEGVGKTDDTLLRAIFHDQSDAVRLRILVVATEEEAARIKARLDKGADFRAEARASLDPAGRDGAPLWRVRGQLEPAACDLAFSRPLGETVGPVKLSLGVALFQVVERTIGTEQEFASKREALAKFASDRMRTQARQHYVSQLRKQAGAEVDEAFLRSTGKRLEATPEEAAHAVARVHGKPLTYGELLPEIHRLARGMEGGHFSGASVKSEVANLAVNQRVIEEAAAQAGSAAGPELEAALAPIRRDETVRAYAADLRARAAKPTGTDIEAFYKANLAGFQRPGSRSCAHLLARSRDQADIAMKRIRGGQPFGDVARDLSADASTAAAGGQLGSLTDAQVGEIAQGEPALGGAIRDGKAGEVSGPVKSRSGWHLVRCEAYQPPAPAPLAEVSAAIAQKLERDRGDDAIRARFAELRGKARISIDEAAVQRAAARK